MKPIVLAGSWVVKAPLARLYQIVTDFEHASEYFPLVAAKLKIINKNHNSLTIEAVAKTFGIPFHVSMHTQLLPGKGFTSVNSSILAIENESFLMEEIAEGTRITYRNEVQIKNTVLQLFGRLMIGQPALWFWKWAYIDRLERLANR